MLVSWCVSNQNQVLKKKIHIMTLIFMKFKFRSVTVECLDFSEVQRDAKILRPSSAVDGTSCHQ